MLMIVIINFLLKVGMSHVNYFDQLIIDFRKTVESEFKLNDIANYFVNSLDTKSDMINTFTSSNINKQVYKDTDEKLKASFLYGIVHKVWHILYSNNSNFLLEAKSIFKPTEDSEINYFDNLIIFHENACNENDFILNNIKNKSFNEKSHLGDKITILIITKILYRNRNKLHSLIADENLNIAIINQFIESGFDETKTCFLYNTIQHLVNSSSPVDDKIIKWINKLHNDFIAKVTCEDKDELEYIQKKIMKYIGLIGCLHGIRNNNIRTIFYNGSFLLNDFNTFFIAIDLINTWIIYNISKQNLSDETKHITKHANINYDEVFTYIETDASVLNYYVDIYFYNIGNFKTFIKDIKKIKEIYKNLPNYKNFVIAVANHYHSKEVVQIVSEHLKTTIQ